MIRTFIYVLIGLFGFFSPVFAGNLPEGMPDYVDDKLLDGVLTCDSGVTKFSGYDMRKSGKRGWGMTIVINNKTHYYIFTPNPKSMSPEVWTWVVDADGNLKKIPNKELYEDLKKEAPNLYARFMSAGNDCTLERFSK